MCYLLQKWRARSHVDLDQGPTKWNLLGEVAGVGGVAGGIVPLSKRFQMRFACEMRERSVSEGGWIVDDYVKAS